MSLIDSKLRRVQSAPTIPIYKISDLPQDPTFGQIIIGADDSINWYDGVDWLTSSSADIVVGNVPNDPIEGQIVLGKTGSLCWYSNAAWHGVGGTQIQNGNFPLDPVEGQVVIGNNSLCWYQDGNWYGVVGTVVSTTTPFVLTVVMGGHNDSSHPFLIDLADNDLNGGNGGTIATAIAVFGNPTLIERNPSSSITWTYNGSDTLTIDLVDASRPNWWYQPYVSNALAGFVLARSDASGHMFVSYDPSSSAGPINTDPTSYYSPFDARVQPSETGSSLFASVASWGANDSRISHTELFQVGTSGPISDLNTIEYDGNLTITGTVINPISGHNYSLLVTPTGYNTPASGYIVSGTAP